LFEIEFHRILCETECEADRQTGLEMRIGNADWQFGLENPVGIAVWVLV